MIMTAAVQSPHHFSLKSSRVVCLPIFGVVRLLLVRLALGRQIEAYYDRWPVYGKVLIRWCKVSPEKLERLFSFLLRIRVKRVADSDLLRGSSEINLSAMKRVVTLQQKLRNEILTTGWMALLAEIIGSKPALAYYYRRFPHLEIWPSIIAAAICSDLADEDREIIVASFANWPEAWRKIVDEALESFGWTTFSWPRWYAFAVRQVTAFSYILRLLATTVFTLARHGWPKSTRPSPDRMSVAIEFIEYTRMQGAPVDTNYFEDNQRLPRSEMLYFLTDGQARLLKREGRDVSDMLAQARADGFRVVRLAQLRYSWSSLRLAVRVTSSFVLRMFQLGAPCLARTFWFAWNDYLSQAVLFDSYRPRNYLHTMAPNGSTGLRLDSAIVTSLCRKYGTRSVGYQNRCIYDDVYEDCFDCYDVYLAWGEAWRAVLGPGNEFIEQIVCVGCHNNDELFAANARLPRSVDGRLVTIFSSDLGGNLSPKTSTIDLLETSIELAKRHRDWRFQVKMKDPGMVDVLLSDESFASQCESVKSNFEFLRLARHDCAAAIWESDVVIGAAWTTPATDALILGKRVIYYDAFNSGGAAFADLPDMIARSRTELLRLFEIATSDYRNYATKHGRVLAQLDPFRDGKVKSRILDVLLDNNHPLADHIDALQRNGGRELGTNQILPLEKVS